VQAQPTRLAATRIRADVAKAAAAGFVGAVLTGLSREALASRLIKDRSAAPNQSASKRAPKFFALPRNKKKRQTNGNNIFANRDHAIIDVQIQTFSDAVADKSANNAAYPTEKCSRQQ